MTDYICKECKGKMSKKEVSRKNFIKTLVLECENCNRDVVKDISIKKRAMII